MRFGDLRRERSPCVPIILASQEKLGYNEFSGGIEHLKKEGRWQVFQADLALPASEAAAKAVFDDPVAREYRLRRHWLEHHIRVATNRMDVLDR